ncbi:Protein CfxQ-like protein [Fusarium oxysporum f. sp. rapae]|uniref:Protein CfxQ-like protein n=1 Tax=Fusarium oxysporum f. sp. rapae TaxID=485398 RepID=A0A8J5P252_FUSOX|nr:Protein CfxQ-like protein [Fusarium oxysporum f. sp. rapae]
MVGHEQVKAHFLAVKEKVDIAKRWNKSMKDWTFDLLIHGRNGTAGRALVEGPDFTNAHTVAEEVDKVCERYQKHKEATWMAWAKTHSPGDGEPVGPEHFKDGITLEDVLGIKPWTFRNDSTTWNQLQELVGLRQVKEDVDHIVDLAEVNYQHQLHGLKPLPISHNRCFLGALGVGKTTVAALYAKILTELGLLSKGHVITKKASDLIGRYCGHSEGDTAQALEEAKGGVLIIDDAHLLYQERADGTNDSDDFRQGVIDTLVANVSGSPGEDRCVILCGYEDRMERMFLRSNSGLGRRFPLENAFRFTSYDDDELGRILKQKMESEDLVATDEAFKVARDMLSRMRRRPNFGNGGDVETLLNQANLRRIRRLTNSMSQFSTLTGQPLKPIDFDPDFDRSTRADENLNALFDDFVGLGHITDRFRKHQKMADGMRRYGIDPKPHIPWAFVFKGPPGTGKTSTARKADKLLYHMGFLSSDEVVICSVTNLIGQFSGHTGPKVINQFELGLGKVLFIDEAYRLIGDSFHKEAIGELVDVMTKPRYAHNMVVILAGYSDEMEELLMVNPGLRSRIPQMAPEECLKLLEKLLSKLNISLSTSTTGEHKAAVLDVLKQLIDSKGWPSGRDVETLIQTIIELVFTKAYEAEEIPGSEGLCVSCEELMDCLDAMLKDRGGALDDE